MIPEREREALMRLTMCAREECGMCKYEEQCDNWDFRMELATKNMNILADALRKTEPSDSEKPNNCKAKNYCDDCLYTDTCDSKEFFYACTSKATISKKEQVEDEPMKTTDYCDICKRDMCEICVADATNPYCVPSHYEINYEPKDEPQTYVINPQEPTNDDKCFECDDFFTCGGQCNKIKDEPQTDCAWK